ncbi:MAG: type II toxin-antitoxin system VapC family toxin [Acidobacteriaceae bacterium]|nr:type II toxin-antitoxin system VapC family toxin [Acidobacteriaceae bacterium]
MSSVVADTHTIVWYLANDARLSQTAIQALDRASADGEPIYLPSICLVELTYLVEKGRLPSVARDRLIRALDESLAPCRLAPLDRMVADALQLVDRSEVPHMPDRVIAATAIALGVPLISRDAKIRTSTVQTLW